MARELPISLRAKRQQTTAIQRRGSSPSIKSGFIQRERIGATVFQAQRLAGQQQVALDEILNKISSLTNINQINAILNSAPEIIKSQVAVIRKDIQDQQDETLSKLQSRYESMIANTEKYRERKSNAKNEDDRIWYKAKAEGYEAEARELQKFIELVKSGNIYNYGDIISYTGDVRNYEEQRVKYRYEKKKAEAKAQEEALKQTLENIKKAGYTPVYSSGSLIGYKAGADTGYAEYRFDNSGNSYLLKSTRFKPVYSGGKITGYEDLVAGMSIGLNTFDKYIKNINQQASAAQASYTKFQTELKKVTLPTGYKFERDSSGNIVSIDDIKRGVNLDLAELPTITPAWVINPTLAKIYGVDYKSFFKNLKSSLKLDPNYVKELRWYEKFSPQKVIDYTYQRRYNFYKNDFGGKLSYDDFIKAQWKAPDRNFQKTTEGQKIIKALNKSLTDQIKNPEKYGTTTRLSGLLTIGSGAGLPSASLILFGSTYFGTINLGKEVSYNPLPKDFKSTAKIVAKSFGLGAVEGLLYGLAFKGGGAILQKLGKPLLKVSFLAKPGISKATQLAIQRGLSILGVNYVSRLAGRTTYNLKNIAIGDQELGVSGISKDVGILVGFALPSVITSAIRRASNKDISKIKINKKTGKVKMTSNQRKAVQKEVARLEKLRQGQLNAAYLKAKNAQIKSNIRGRVITQGVKREISPSTLDQIYSKSKSLGITKKQLIEGSFYKQTIRVRSDVGKTETLLTYYKQLLSGRFKGNIRAPSEYYTFTRYGISFATTDSRGVSKAIAIEFNLSGRKPTNIGYKYGVGVGKTSLVSVYKKARAVQGKGIRVRLQDVYVAKNKFQSTKRIGNDLVATLNRIETKRVLLNGKRLSRREILVLKNEIKKQIRLGKNKNLESTLIRLFKDNRITGTSGYTNTIRIEQTSKGVSIRVLSSATKGIRLSPGGKFMEIGLTKFKIPSAKVIRISAPKISRVPKRVKLSRTRITKTKLPRIETQPIKSTSRIITKKSITKIQEKKLQQSVRAIQTITRPITRVRISKRVVPASVVKNITTQIGILLPLVSSKNRQALRSIQSNLNKSANALRLIQRLDSVNINLLKQIKVLQSKNILALKTITAPKPIIPIVPSIQKPRTPRRPTTTKKTPVVVPLPQSSAAKRGSRERGDLGYVSGLGSTKTRRVVKTLISIPITKERAFDILAYAMLKRKKRSGLVKKSQKETPKSIINRNYKSVPKGFFRRFRSRFLVRRLKSREEIYQVFLKDQSMQRKVARKKSFKPRTKKVVRRSRAIVRRKAAKKVSRKSPKRSPSRSKRKR